MDLKQKAVIVGGSNGIGFAIAKQLCDNGKQVTIVDKEQPAECLANAKYIACNLVDFDYQLFKSLASDETVDTLVITAGIGAITEFENLNIVDIDYTMKINSLAVLKIIHAFYHRIKCEKRFYSCVMGSIAGLISSPMFSVYAASKAAVGRFVESVNIEIEASGYSNRILNVSPGAIKGTKFNGGQNDFSLTKKLAGEIITHMLRLETVYIPDYESVYKNVLDRYLQNAHDFGMSSYQYKKESGRVAQSSRIKIGYLSGTFDLFHVGHLNLLKRAKEQCDYLIVGVHRDAKHKNKETFISFEERMAIVGSVRYVDEVVPSCMEDTDAWELYQYNRLFVGSDYKGSERFCRYEQFFANKDVEIIYFPYTQTTSSTQLRAAIEKKIDE